MRSRLRVFLVSLGMLALAGCTDSFNGGPVRFKPTDQLAVALDGKPRLQLAIVETTNDLFGDSPRAPRAPEGNPLPLGGAYLGNHYKVAGEEPETIQTPKYYDETLGKEVLLEGGYALYREHCLHCHGTSGDGEGPTAEFLWPRPRDYRPGVFKFTSTETEKPTRDDLRRIIRHGIDNSSMPAFQALMTPNEMEQVIDYVMFLSMRGETERLLINEATALGDEELGEISSGMPNEDTARMYLDMVFMKWGMVGDRVLNPPEPRVKVTEASIHRGRDLFLGRTKEKLECAGCHGMTARGDGPSFVAPKVFDDVVFRGKGTGRFDETAALDAIRTQEQSKAEGEAVTLEDLPETMPATPGGFSTQPIPTAELVERLLERGLVAKVGVNGFKTTATDQQLADMRTERDLWMASLDDWGDPLRPANLNKGYYKGGRRPIDLYWRIAKGINGAKMPGHSAALQPDQIWDLVNFVLALPSEPELLTDAPPAPAPAPPQVANR